MRHVHRSDGVGHVDRLEHQKNSGVVRPQLCRQDLPMARQSLIDAPSILAHLDADGIEISDGVVDLVEGR